MVNASSFPNTLKQYHENEDHSIQNHLGDEESMVIKYIKPSSGSSIGGTPVIFHVNYVSNLWDLVL
jgi:hypothetical protein